MTIDWSSEKEFIAAIKKYAIANYEKDGWDYLVETWEDSDILEACEGAASFDDAIAKIAPKLKLLDNYRKEIKSTEF